MAGGKHRASNPNRTRVGSVVAASAVPLVLAVAGSGTATAAPAQSDAVPQHHAAHPQSPASNIPNAQPRISGDVLTSLPSARPLPDQRYLAPVGELHAPKAVAPVAPIAPPPGKFRFGDVQLNAPTWINRDQEVAVNDQSARAEAGLATFLDSVGMERSRSDRIAGATVGDAAIGAAAGATASAPLAATSGLVGGVAGLVVGVPFLPIGLVAGPALGAAIGTGVITVPAAAMGAAAGAAVGAAQGFAAPPHVVAG
ncbi:hypothetical protein K7711_29000 [Nocardia sp. CA2R105]|uniref:hypothetical protein n=1 Tax=Nocardia coffeae TaxID=2873381 RepID=UPI001CA7A66A|nr:hypothetical protein [Nocardia coffeae]MBY8860540.1 hypothetical protein [Nocardia coffeae]